MIFRNERDFPPPLVADVDGLGFVPEVVPDPVALAATPHQAETAAA